MLSRVLYGDFHGFRFSMFVQRFLRDILDLYALIFKAMCQEHQKREKTHSKTLKGNTDMERTVGKA